MIKAAVTAADVVALLNEALKLDPEAITTLVNGRALCNGALAGHPQITVLNAPPEMHQGEVVAVELAMNGAPEQTDPVPVIEVRKHLVGLIGLLNGVFGLNDRGWGPITMAVDPTSGLVQTFLVTPEP